MLTYGFCPRSPATPTKEWSAQELADPEVLARIGNRAIKTVNKPSSKSSCHRLLSSYCLCYPLYLFPPPACLLSSWHLFPEQCDHCKRDLTEEGCTAFGKVSFCPTWLTQPRPPWHDMTCLTRCLRCSTRSASGATAAGRSWTASSTPRMTRPTVLSATRCGGCFFVFAFSYSKSMTNSLNLCFKLSLAIGQDIYIHRYESYFESGLVFALSKVKSRL